MPAHVPPRQIGSLGMVGVLLFWSLSSHAQEVSSGEEQEVTIRGKMAVALGEEEGSTTAIRGEALKAPGTDAARLLSRVPGVQVQRTGTNSDPSTLSIRGASASQIPVYLAGVRLNDDIVGVADLSRIPLWMIYEVDVYRSTSPLHVSRAGLSGAVLFEPTLPRQKQFLLGSQAGSFGSGALWTGAALPYESASAKVRGATSISYRRSGAQNNFTYHDDRGTAFVPGDDGKRVRENADELSDDIWLMSKASFHTGNGPARLSFIANAYQREQGVSSLSLLPASKARADLSRGLFALKADVPCSGGPLRCALSAQSSLSLTGLETRDPADELHLGSDSVFQESQRINQQIGVAISPHAKLRTKLSAVYEVSRLGLSVPEQKAPSPADESLLAGILSLGFTPTDDWLLRGEGRVSCLSSRGEESAALSFSGDNDFEHRISDCLPEARLGASLQLNDSVSIRGTLLRGVRFPTLGERFGVSATTRGNPSLEAEEGWSGDLGLRYQPAGGRVFSYALDGALFARSTQNLVAYRRSALSYLRPYNVEAARFLGGELAGQALAWSLVRYRISGALLDAQDTSSKGGTGGGQHIPFRSALTLNQELEVFSHFTEQGVSHLGASVLSDYRSSRAADPAGLIVIPGHMTWDFAVRAEFQEMLNVRARLENVFNVSRFDTIGFPLPGRSFWLSGEITLR